MRVTKPMASRPLDEEEEAQATSKKFYRAPQLTRYGRLDVGDARRVAFEGGSAAMPQ